MIIRKISIGNDLLNAMHYQVGKNAMGGTAVISDIIKNSEGSYDIYVQREEDGIPEVIMWKNIGNTVAVSIEYNLEF